MAVFAAQHQAVACDTLKMNQLCKVCGEPAAGFHFGAFTCEGCKSFFGRSYNNLSVISECKNGGQCVINKKNRTSCKACRLRKCLLVGMSKSGSRYGRRSNWFKLHCLMQEQAPSAANGGSVAPGVGSPESALSMPSPAFHGLRRGFHPHALHGLSSVVAMTSSGHVPSSMSSNESKDDERDECKNSTSPSVSSPGSHHSDSSLEAMEAKSSASINLSPYGHLKLATPLAHPALYGADGKDFGFGHPLGMHPAMTAMLPPHLQAAAAAAAAAAANLHSQHLAAAQSSGAGGGGVGSGAAGASFFPPNLPAPRLLFPGLGSLHFGAPAASPGAPSASLSKSSGGGSTSFKSESAPKFSVDAVLKLKKETERKSPPPADEQDSPMDLSVKKCIPSTRRRHRRRPQRQNGQVHSDTDDADLDADSDVAPPMDSDDPDADDVDLDADLDADEELDDDDDDSSERNADDLLPSERKKLRPAAHPLDLTRK